MSRNVLSAVGGDASLAIYVCFGLICGLGEGALRFWGQHLAALDIFYVTFISTLIIFVTLGLINRALTRIVAGQNQTLTLAACSVLTIINWASVVWQFQSQKRLIAVFAVSLAAVSLFLKKRHTWAADRAPLISTGLLVSAVLIVMGAIPLATRCKERMLLSHLRPTKEGTPNVLLIIVDTLRADHLSTYGYTQQTTPSLTRLAKQGVLFENAIATSSWSLPSHASILTGRYPHEHHADTLGSYLDTRYPTIAEAFRDAGYRTAAFSGNTFFFSRGTGLERGFLHFEDHFETLGSALAKTFFGDLIQGALYRLRWKTQIFGRRNAQQINHSALKWIDGDSRPFFAVLNYFDVHDPYLPPSGYENRFSANVRVAPRISASLNRLPDLTPRELRGEKLAYDCAIRYVDDSIAELVRQLEVRGLKGNTLVIITSDHGESFHEHGLIVHANALYRELVQVPLLIMGPGIPAGKTVTLPISTRLLPATLLDIAGQKGPSFPGPSLRSLWTSTERSEFPYPLSELAQLRISPTFPNYYGPLRSLITPHWHYILGAHHQEELYPYSKGEHEEDDLAHTSDGKETCLKLKREMDYIGKGTDGIF